MKLKWSVILFTIVLIGITAVNLLAENNSTGTNALSSITTGTGNAAYGENAGYSATTGLNNLFLGDYSGYRHTTGRGNIYLGPYSQYYSSTGATLDNQLYIGSNLGTIIHGDIANGYVYFGGVRGSAEPFGFIANSDTVTINPDGTDVHIRASDGPINFDTATNLTGVVTFTDSLKLMPTIHSNIADSSLVLVIDGDGNPKIQFFSSGADVAHILHNADDQLIFSGAAGGNKFGTKILGQNDNFLINASAGSWHTDAILGVRPSPTSATDDSTIYMGLASGVPTLYFKGTDDDAMSITVDTDDKMQFDGASGGYDFDADIAAGANIGITGYITATDSVVTAGNITAGNVVSNGNLGVNGYIDRADSVVTAGNISTGSVVSTGTVSITRSTSANGYTNDVASEWTPTADMTSGGSNGIYGIANPVKDLQNAYALRGRMDMRDATDDTTYVGQLHSIDGLINLNETKGYQVEDNISVVGAAIHGGDTGSNITGLAGGIDGESLNLFFGMWGPTADQEYDIATNGLLIITHHDTNLDYGVQIQSSSDMDAGIYLRSHESNSPATMDVGIEMASADGKMLSGIDMSAADFSTADIILSEGETIDNMTDGRVQITADSTRVTGDLHVAGQATIADSLSVGQINYKKQTFLDIDADYQILAEQSGAMFVATTIGAKRRYTLPAAAAGLTFSFFVNDSDSLLIDGSGSNGIKDETNAYAVYSTDVGSLTITAYNGTTWAVESRIGTWIPY